MGKTLTLRTADGHDIGAYLAEPEGRPRGGIVVVQEIFGVNAHIRSVVDRYAAAGWRAIGSRVSPSKRPCGPKRRSMIRPSPACPIATSVLARVP
ncbi:carboxymethylenebutenolidase [mine drainage metagenome]|uniref:Carboxymethylenebutenolidase n=1 Tax=mine drainage metagenome TaxID=410659 RepID=A0A1J5QQA3_9ZZZZ